VVEEGKNDDIASLSLSSFPSSYPSEPPRVQLEYSTAYQYNVWSTWRTPFHLFSSFSHSLHSHSRCRTLSKRTSALSSRATCETNQYSPVLFTGSSTSKI